MKITFTVHLWYCSIYNPANYRCIVPRNLLLCWTPLRYIDKLPSPVFFTRKVTRLVDISWYFWQEENKATFNRQWWHKFCFMALGNKGHCSSECCNLGRGENSNLKHLAHQMHQDGSRPKSATRSQWYQTQKFYTIPQRLFVRNSCAEKDQPFRLGWTTFGFEFAKQKVPQHILVKLIQWTTKLWHNSLNLPCTLYDLAIKHIPRINKWILKIHLSKMYLASLSKLKALLLSVKKYNFNEMLFHWPPAFMLSAS